MSRAWRRAAALHRGVPPDSAEADQVIDRILERPDACDRLRSRHRGRWLSLLPRSVAQSRTKRWEDR
jgi:hypothetical protein